MYVCDKRGTGGGMVIIEPSRGRDEFTAADMDGRIEESNR